MLVAITQGVALATGLQSKFSFAGVAAAGVAAGVGHYVGDNVGGAAIAGKAATFGNFAASSAASAIANAATRSAINGESFGQNLIAAIPDVIAGILQKAICTAADGVKSEKTSPASVVHEVKETTDPTIPQPAAQVGKSAVEADGTTVGQDAEEDVIEVTGQRPAKYTFGRSLSQDYFYGPDGGVGSVITAGNSYDPNARDLGWKLGDPGGKKWHELLLELYANDQISDAEELIELDIKTSPSQEAAFAQTILGELPVDFSGSRRDAVTQYHKLRTIQNVLEDLSDNNSAFGEYISSDRRVLSEYLESRHAGAVDGPIEYDPIGDIVLTGGLSFIPGAARSLWQLVGRGFAAGASDDIAKGIIAWNGAQGASWEAFLAKANPAWRSLDDVPRSIYFKTFDFFDDAGRIAISAKSLNLSGGSYAKPNAVFNKLKGYIDEAAEFTTYTRPGSRGTVRLQASDIARRQLGLVIPTKATEAQLLQVSRAVSYGAKNGVEVVIRRAH